jgi:large subunit ribosomal protein L32
MALPKRKHSRSRRDKRRANWKLAAPTLVKCPGCQRLKPAHVACPACGRYSAKVSVPVVTKEKKRK